LHSAVICNLDTAQRNLTALQQLGLRVGLDDFATGYWSLNHLTTLPIGCFKIDRTFVQQLESSLISQVIIDTVNSMAGALKFSCELGVSRTK
jgi:diguanylate cyclase